MLPVDVVACPNAGDAWKANPTAPNIAIKIERIVLRVNLKPMLPPDSASSAAAADEGSRAGLGAVARPLATRVRLRGLPRLPDAAYIDQTRQACKTIFQI